MSRSQKLAQFGRKNSTSMLAMLAAFCISDIRKNTCCSVSTFLRPRLLHFSALGWTPEGDVFFDYDSRVPGFGNCTCSACFTATAYGDLDASGALSEITYFHPGQDGGFCTVGISDNSPPKNADDDDIWDSPVHHPLSDSF